MSKIKYLKPLKKLQYFGCLNCSWGELAEGRALKVRMDYMMEWESLVPDKITYNGETYFHTRNLKAWGSKSLSEIEKEARKKPGDWRLHIETALRNAVYQRQGKNKWVLVKSGEGFA